MSENHQRPTIATDVALPVKIVTLLELKTTDGQPVRVQCERLDSLEAAAVLGTLPGAIEILTSTAAAQGDTLETINRFRPLGSVLIERAAFMLNADGSVKRPSFWFTSEVPGAFPVRLLDSVDFTLLTNTILQLRGYLGGAAAEGGFSAGQSGGQGDRERAVEGCSGDGGFPTGGAGAPGPAVHDLGAAGAPGMEAVSA